MTITLKEAQRRRVTRRRHTGSNGTAREYSQRNPLAAALALVKVRDAAASQGARTTNAADDLEAMRAEQTDWH